MSGEGSKLTQLQELSGVTAQTDLFYIVRGILSYSMTVSQLRVYLVQIQDMSTLAKQFNELTTTNQWKDLLNYGALADLEEVNTLQLVDACVTLAKMAALAQYNIIIGDDTNRPSALATTAIGRALLAAADEAAAQAAIGIVSSNLELTNSDAAAFVYGEVGYLHTDGTVKKCQSDGTEAEAQLEVICIEAAGVAVAAPGTFSTGGIIPGLTGGSAGALAYVSATAGALTNTAPSSGYSAIVGRWISTTVLNFRPRDPFYLG